MKEITTRKKIRELKKLYKEMKDLIRRGRKALGVEGYKEANQLLKNGKESIKTGKNTDVLYKKLMSLKKEKLNRYVKGPVRDFIESLIWAGILALIVRGIFLQPFKIPTGSMEPTLHGDYRNGDRIFANRIIYGFRIPYIVINTARKGKPYEVKHTPVILPIKEPARWDIMIFQTRNIPMLEHQYKDFIKRVVGLPGETVEIRDGDIYINGKYIKKPDYLKGMDGKEIKYENTVFAGSARGGEYGQKGKPVNIPEGMYFVLGDNTGVSKDSRFWGFVPRENILGRAFFIWFPISSRWGYLR